MWYTWLISRWIITLYVYHPLLHGPRLMAELEKSSASDAFFPIDGQPHKTARNAGRMQPKGIKKEISPRWRSGVPQGCALTRLMAPLMASWRRILVWCVQTLPLCYHDDRSGRVIQCHSRSSQSDPRSVIMTVYYSVKADLHRPLARQIVRVNFNWK